MKSLPFARQGLWIAATAAAALAAGCSSPVKLDTPPPVESRSTSGASTGTGSAGTGGTPQSQVTSVDLNSNANNGAPRIVYFDFDSFVVKDEFRPVIESQGKVLSADRARKVALEGHTDERGGREYNLALGQKRAEAVAQSLKLVGANDNQLEAVSYGKERPAVQGNDEAAWAKNRRVEISQR